MSKQCSNKLHKIHTLRIGKRLKIFVRGRANKMYYLPWGDTRNKQIIAAGNQGSQFDDLR